jgi:hypothetical protein
MGTVDDMERLLDAGYAHSLMLDFWSGGSGYTDNPFDHDVLFLAPALVGKGGQQAPFAKSGTCSLLVDDKCTLHDKGLKPIQGKLACCKIERVYLDSAGEQRDLDERLPILHTWNTQRGQDVIARWKQEVSFDDQTYRKKEDLSLGEMVELAMDVLMSKVELYTKTIDEPTDMSTVDVKVYEKPY